MKGPLNTGFPPIDDYISTLAPEIGDRIYQICQAVGEVAPAAEGRISYNMPAFFHKGRLVYFCAFKRHIGFYPASMKVFEEFRDELAEFKQSGRGTVQFPHDSELPIDLIRRIVEFRVKENETKARAER